MSWRTSIATAAVRTGFGPLLYAGRLPEAARVAAELGHEGIELSLRAPWELDRAELAALLAAHHLRLVAIGSGRGSGVDPEQAPAAATSTSQARIPIPTHEPGRLF